MEEESLQQKIARAVARPGRNYKILAQLLEVPLPSMYKWKDGANPRNPREYQSVMRSLDALLLRDSQEKIPSSQSEQTENEDLTQKNSDVMKSEPVVVDDKVVGSIATQEGQLVLGGQKTNFPLLSTDGFIQVNNDSMAPKFPNGCWIAITKLKYPHLINVGYYYYLVDKNLKGIVRKVTSIENEELLLLSENESSYPSFRRKLADVISVFSVDAVLIML